MKLWSSGWRGAAPASFPPASVVCSSLSHRQEASGSPHPTPRHEVTASAPYSGGRHPELCGGRGKGRGLQWCCRPLGGARPKEKVGKLGKGVTGRGPDTPHSQLGSAVLCSLKGLLFKRRGK